MIPEIAYEPFPSVIVVNSAGNEFDTVSLFAGFMFRGTYCSNEFAERYKLLEVTSIALSVVPRASVCSNNLCVWFVLCTGQVL